LAGSRSTARGRHRDGHFVVVIVAIKRAGAARTQPEAVAVRILTAEDPAFAARCARPRAAGILSELFHATCRTRDPSVRTPRSCSRSAYPASSSTAPSRTRTC
jgi:hypothetical protein